MSGGKKAENNEADAKKKFTRRDFLVTGGTVVAVDALISASPVKAAAERSSQAPAGQTTRYPASRGYLVYDGRKCINCTTCMLSCSLVHYGVQNLSLSRIQIMHDSFGKFPDDVIMAPCRQCVDPPCVRNCPVGAAYVDTENGNVRRIDGNKCIGCRACLSMCPQQPHRTIWNHETGRATKCDLCLDSPHWNEKGGPGGRQACVESCPVQAIRFVSAIPNQKETEGYDVNLRNQYWLRLGLVDDSRIQPPSPAPKAKKTTPAPKQ